MSEDPASRAAAHLVDEAWDAYREGRYPRALDAARRGVEAAELPGDLVVQWAGDVPRPVRAG